MIFVSNPSSSNQDEYMWRAGRGHIGRREFKGQVIMMHQYLFNNFKEKYGSMSLLYIDGSSTAVSFNYISSLIPAADSDGVLYYSTERQW